MDMRKIINLVESAGEGVVDSLTPNTAFNASRYPVVDRNGRAFTPGCRITYRLSTHGVNFKQGTGTVKKIDMYGGIYYTADQPEPVYDQNGHVQQPRVEQYASEHTFDRENRQIVSASRLGDPHEHGTVDTYVEVID